MIFALCVTIGIIKTEILVDSIMKFTIERASLLKTLSHMQSIVEKRNTIPVLSNVRIEALNGEISFKATDMDTEITEMVEAGVSETGATTAPAHMLYDIVRKLSDGSDVEITFPDEKGRGHERERQKERCRQAYIPQRFENACGRRSQRADRRYP